jgi:hypothetical protein
MILKLKDKFIASGPLIGGHWRDPEGNVSFTFGSDKGGAAGYIITFTPAEMLKLGSELMAEVHAQRMAKDIRTMGKAKAKRFLGGKNGKV